MSPTGPEVVSDTGERENGQQEGSGMEATWRGWSAPAMFLSPAEIAVFRRAGVWIPIDYGWRGPRAGQPAATVYGVRAYRLPVGVYGAPRLTRRMRPRRATVRRVLR